MMDPILSVENLHVRYGGIHAVQGVSFTLGRGAVLGLLGRNGAGKSTTLRAIMSIGPSPTGKIQLNGRGITGERSYRVAQAGVAFVPETRAIFASLTVRENLMIAARPPVRSDVEPWTMERVFNLFPRLAERLNTGGGQLSGGEQQMLSIARALLTNPQLLLLDEPTEGLAPVVVEQLVEALQSLKRSGLSILLVEQNLPAALAVVDRVLVVGKGSPRWEGTPEEFAGATEVRDTWLTV